jgi:hypothetical protein
LITSNGTQSPTFWTKRAELVAYDRDIKQIGDIFTVTVAITIDNVTREGIGTGSAESELGIKKAEHDALKRAAVKFGIARELYKKESDVIEREGAVQTQQEQDFRQIRLRAAFRIW